MIKIINSKEFFEKGVSKLISYEITQLDSIKQEVIKILQDVKNRGDQALIDYTEKFDSIKLNKNNIKISKQIIEDAYKLVPTEFIEAIRFAKNNIEKFHKAQLRNEWNIETINGVKVGQIYRAIESVGIYIPGGKAVYPSTVLMTAIPAKVAGVKRIALCSPPHKININNRDYIGIHPSILVAANECKVDEIYQIGSAWAIGALTYGTEMIKPVLKIVGPGNKYVNIAKILVKDLVSIDTEAGPSEIAIIADESSNPIYVAHDLISQIEHDPDNVGILISQSESLINKVIEILPSIINSFKRKNIILESLSKKGLIIKTNSLEESIEISNEIAAEHLEILISDYNKVLPKINNAGAIFLGNYSPVPIGDYVAGSNHVLPTGGAAKRISGLTTWEFIKTIDFVECSNEGLIELEKYLSILAEFEGLDAHRDAVKIRLKK